MHLQCDTEFCCESCEPGEKYCIDCSIKNTFRELKESINKVNKDLEILRVCVVTLCDAIEIMKER